MSDATAHKSDHAHLPKPIVKKMLWPFPIIWIVPIFAALFAGYFFYSSYRDRGPLIALTFSDATGLRPGESKLMHLGVAIGEVVDTQLSADQKGATVHVRLDRPEASFATKGAKFWIVRPQISAQEISGLATIISGPYIDATPGSGETQTDFIGLQDPPVTVEEGLRVVLKAANLQHLQANSPVYFRGIQVGVIEGIDLSSDATTIDVRIFIHKRFSPLLTTNSQFWVVSGVDFKGGLFTGVQLKVDSLRSLISGGIAFATPEQDIGEPAKTGSEFVLHEDSKKEWLDWAPKIQIGPDDSGNGQTDPSVPQPPQAIRSAVGS